MSNVVIECDLCGKNIIEFLGVALITNIGLGNCRSCSPDSTWTIYDWGFEPSETGITQFCFEEDQDGEEWKN